MVMIEYPPCLQGRTIILALLTFLLIIMFITAVAKDQMIKRVYCSKNGTNIALKILISMKERIYHHTLAMTEATAANNNYA